MMARSSADAQRQAMFADVHRGAGKAISNGDASKKWLIGRGCDPVMARQSIEMIPPMLGNVNYVATCDDDTFFAKLKERKYDVVFFAPGACRWSKAKQPIPGGNSASRGWSLEQYHSLVRELQGPDVKIVGSSEEREIIPLLREALGL